MREVGPYTSYNTSSALQVRRSGVVTTFSNLPSTLFYFHCTQHCRIPTETSLANMARGADNGTERRVSKPDIQEAEYDYMNNGHGNGNTNDNLDNVLHRARTTGAVSLSAELFEKLYLSPKTAVKGELRATFGNPTPMYVC